MQVVVDSLLTTYERMGSGRVVVFLHGWGDGMASSRVLRKELSRAYDVIALDLPGFGGTQTPPAAWGLDGYVRFVAHFLKKIGAGHVYCLMGHSNGGAMLIRGLANGTLQADRAVLMASAGIRTPKSFRNRMLKVAAKTAKVFMKPLSRSVQQKMRVKAYGAIGSDYLVAPQLRESFTQIVSEDVRGDAVQLIMPTLLIYGEADADTPVWYGELYHELMVDSTLVILPSAGHFVYLDRPDDVVARCKEFLA